MKKLCGVRRDEADVVSRQTAHDAREERGKDKNGDLIARNIHPDDLRGHLRAAQCAQRATERRVDQILARPDAEQQNAGKQPVPASFAEHFNAEERQRGHGHAVGASGVAPLILDDDGDDDAQSQRRHRQIMTAQTEDRRGDRRGQKCGADGSGAQRDDRRAGKTRGQDCRSIGPDAEKTGVSETDLAGEPHQQIERQYDDRVDRHAIDDIEIVRVRQEPWQRQQNSAEHEEAGIRARHTRSVTLAPNTPRGLKNRTMKIIKNGTASL